MVLIFLISKVNISINVFLEIRDNVGVCIDNLYECLFEVVMF